MSRKNNISEKIPGMISVLMLIHRIDILGLSLEEMIKAFYYLFFSTKQLKESTHV
jgi:hypothetical protein